MIETLAPRGLYAILISGALLLIPNATGAQEPAEPTAPGESPNAAPAPAPTEPAADAEPTAPAADADPAVPGTEADPAAPAAEPPPAAPPSTILSGKEIYARLSKAARAEGEVEDSIPNVLSAGDAADWSAGRDLAVLGNLRRLEVVGADKPDDELFLVRARTGEIYVLMLPADAAAIEPGSESPYAGLRDAVKNKMTFELRLADATVNGVHFTFAKLKAVPQRALLDRLFFIAIVLLLFLTMVGMGLTLTLGDFGLVFKKPRGMIVGLICQFGVLPLLVMLLGRAVGYYESYPFIFLGMILVSASPGGVTSNLMTYFGKGDVALSVSLTAVCTVLALVFTPLLLTLYGGNIPDFTVPAGEVFKTMLVLVIVPLFVGMLVRNRSERLAKRAEKPFAGIGVLALLFLIVVGIFANLDEFANTDRYGLKFYLVVVAMTLIAMVSGGLAAKLARVSNFQARAISLEVGVRNASLAMTIAILLQDRLGDFSASMFFTSGIFGLAMYGTGALIIYSFKRLLPVDEKPAAG